MDHSFCLMDPDVEIPPPIHQKPSRFIKQKQPFTLSPEYDLGLKKTRNSTLHLNKSKIQGSKMSRSSFQIKTDDVNRFSGTKAAPKKKSSSSQRVGLDLSAKQGASSSSSLHSSFFGHNGSLYTQGIESGNPCLKSSYDYDDPPEHVHGKTSVRESARVGHNGASVVPPGLTTITDEPENETLRKFQSFKQFDTVEDTSDHHFVKHNSSMNQNPKSWAKQIQREWKILEKHLPDTIFVRVFESRMDLLRDVIVGAEGTP